MEKKKVVIFGSTGMIGLCAVEAAVVNGLKVRAFVRDPSLLIPDNLRKAVEVVKGDVLNYADVLGAVKNTTAVVVVLGTRNDLKPTTVMSEGLANIIRAMKELKVEVMSVCLSEFLFFEPDEVPAMYKDLTDEHQRMLDLVKQAGLKSVAVLPPDIKERMAAEYQITYDASPEGSFVSKLDLGRFLVDCLTLPEYHGKVVGITTLF